MKSWSRALLLLSLVLLACACPKAKSVGLDPQAVPVPAQPPPIDNPPQVQEEKPPAKPPRGSAEGPATRLLPDEAGVREVQSTLAQVEQLLGTLAERTLTDPQREERNAGSAFVGQARGALQSGELDRAAVLAGKALALIENLVRVTGR